MPDNKPPSRHSSRSNRENRSEHLRESIRELTSSRGIKQGYVAERANIESGTLSAFMRGRSASMREDSMVLAEHAVKLILSEGNIHRFERTQKPAGRTNRVETSSRDSDINDPIKSVKRTGVKDRVIQEMAEVLRAENPEVEADLREMSISTLMGYYATFKLMMDQAH